MEELKWPVKKCGYCGFDLGEKKPEPKDKALSSDGSRKPMWADFCPKCGTGYVVGERIVPEKKIPKEKFLSTKIPPPEEAPEIPAESEGEAQSLKVSQVEKKETAEEAVPEPPETQRSPKSGEYLCPKCNSIHRETSKVGKRHLKHTKEA